MSTPPEIRAQLQSLRIGTDQRPRHTPQRSSVGKLLVLMLILGGLGAGGYYLVRNRIGPAGDLLGSSAAAGEIRLIKVAARTDPDPPPVLTATGKIVSDHRVQVMAKVSGQIVSLHFEQGDRVKQGQLLARIEDVIYRARREEAAARLNKSKATLAFAKYNYERIAGLRKGGTAPEIEFTEAGRALEEAEAQVAMDQASLASFQKMLSDTEVVAPIAGVVLERTVEVGDFVAAEGGRGMVANAQLAVIADMTKLRVEVDVSELDIARLRTDMPCTIVPEAYKDRRYRGHIMWLDPGANYSKATVQVKVRIENPDDFLRVEGSAQVTFLSEPATSAEASASAASSRPSSESNMHEASAPSTQPGQIWIPASACRLDPTGNSGTVFLLTNEHLKATTVRVGRQAAGQIEILAGLTDGQSIAADGLDRLTDGQRVKS